MEGTEPWTPAKFSGRCAEWTRARPGLRHCSVRFPIPIRTHAMTDSVFTRIARREIPAAIVFEDEHVMAFMDAGQVNPGHVLVAPRRQVETLMELDEPEVAHLFVIAHRVARAVQAAFAPAGMTLLQTNRPAGWQTVPHVHVHVLPRHEGDGVGLEWPRKDPPLADLQALAARIQL